MNQLIHQPQQTVTLQTPGGLQTYQIATDATPEQRAIITASTGRKIATVTQADLEKSILRLIVSGLTLLGHKNHLADPADQAILVRAVASDIRQKFEYRTLEEVSIIFNMGIRGQLRSKPDEVVYINIDQITSWFNLYRIKVKADAMKKLSEAPDPEKETLNLEELKARNPKLAAEIEANFEKFGLKEKPPRPTINQPESKWLERFKAKLPSAEIEELETLLEQARMTYGQQELVQLIETELANRNKAA